MGYRCREYFRQTVYSGNDGHIVLEKEGQKPAIIDVDVEKLRNPYVKACARNFDEAIRILDRHNLVPGEIKHVSGDGVRMVVRNSVGDEAGKIVSDGDDEGFTLLTPRTPRITYKLYVPIEVTESETPERT